MEVQHGLSCLLASYNQRESGKKFKAILNGVFDEIITEIEQSFNGWMHDFLTNTFLVCVSEHEDFEDNFGRLSMWRAYSQSSGVAIVLNTAPFFSQSDALKAYTSAVAYLGDQDFEHEFDRLADRILNERDFIKAQSRQVIVNVVFHVLRFAAICTKHPGFREEKEWRLVYSPGVLESTHLKKEVEIINGVPQPIYKISLQDIPTEGLMGIEIPSLINRIIIGPTQYPVVLYDAFCDLLRQAGVNEPQGRVVISSIPLR